MPIVDGIKHACAQCIRGHRTSTCAHHDRPLIPIRPKGRPPTQCVHCREARKAGTGSHSRCVC
ncbi:MAG: copper fist DNA binding domain-containing protein, partial [Piptocephalis tieghemiana]